MKTLGWLAIFIVVVAMGFDFLENGRNPVFTNMTSTHVASKSIGGNTMDGEAVDIDGDGDMDLILAMEFERNVILINHNGVLTDESLKRFPDSSHDSEDIAIADFDGDGDLDIIFVSEDDQTNEYYQNNGKAVFTNVGHLLPISGTSNVVETTDFNGDGFLDLIIGNNGQNVILINNGKGGFVDDTPNRLPHNTDVTQDIELADIDNDGDLDMVEANETANRILINTNGKFKDESGVRLPLVNDQTREIELADIDRDGDLDIFFANVNFNDIGDPQNRLLINDGKGFFKEVTNKYLPESEIRTVGVKFHDVNSDGYPDLLTGNRFDGLKELVLINKQGKKFVDETADYFPTINTYPFDFVLADFNNDGLTDIYLCNFRGDDILFYRNR